MKIEDAVIKLDRYAQINPMAIDAAQAAEYLNLAIAERNAGKATRARLYAEVAQDYLESLTLPSSYREVRETVLAFCREVIGS